MKSGLLIGGHAAHLDKLADEVRAQDISLFIAASLDDVKRILLNESIDFVFLGWESDPEYRLQVLSHTFSASPTSSIHLLGQGGDPSSFVSGILKGMAE